jgi:hypothetical protein
MSEFTPIEIRVLGVLMEKAVTTPDQYPLSLNALTLGCNQKTSRDPVTDYDEEEIEAALDELRDRRLVLRVDLAGSRVAKYRHQIDTRWELSDAEHALLCLLLLRGPQTLGQLRQRAERMYPFPDLDGVRTTLENLTERALEPTTLVRELPRRPGSKEIRFAHTLAPLVENESIDEPSETPTTVLPPSRRDLEIEELRTQLSRVESELAELREAFETFKSQF